MHRKNWYEQSQRTEDRSRSETSSERKMQIWTPPETGTEQLNGQWQTLVQASGLAEEERENAPMTLYLKLKITFNHKTPGAGISYMAGMWTTHTQQVM